MCSIENITVLNLGQFEEENARTVKIDVSKWLSADTTFSIIVRRPTETEDYFAENVVVDEDGILTWTPSLYDMSIQGSGQVTIVRFGNNNIKKTGIIRTIINSSLPTGASPVHPQPVPSWLTEVLEKADDIISSRVESFEINDEGHLIATLEDGTTEDLGSVVGGGGVSSVNGQTGAVILTANDLNAYTKTEVNTELSKKQDKFANLDIVDNKAYLLPKQGLSKVELDNFQCSNPILSLDITNKYYVDNELEKKQDILTDFSQSGDYTFFHNKVDFTSEVPTCNIVPTTGEHLTNKEYVDTAIPTQTSQLTNNSGFITNAVNNLVNYYLKSETYTKTEVDSLISAISTMSLQVVQTLPTEDIQTNVIYLVPRADSETGNIYDEYIYVSNAWEKIGSTDVDLTGYATETWVNTQISGFLTQVQIEGLISTALGNYYTKSEVDTALSGKQNVIDSTHKLDYSLLDNTPTIPIVDQTYDGTSANAQSGVAVASAIADKLTEPSTNLAVGKYFRVASIDADGHAVLECVDPPTAPVQSVSAAGTVLTPDANGNVDIPFANFSTVAKGLVYLNYSPTIEGGIGFYNGATNIIGTPRGHWTFSQKERVNYTLCKRSPITISNMDYAVKCTMTDGIGAAWTDAEKNSSWKRQTIIKVIGQTATPATSTTPEIITAMDNIAVPGAKYFLGEQSTVSFTLPDTASAGQEITVSWYNGSTPATLTISEGTTPMLDFTYVPSANTRSELNCLWDGSYWSVLGVEQGVPENAE